MPPLILKAVKQIQLPPPHPYDTPPLREGMPFKRRRTDSGRASAPRPIDKKIISISITATGATQATLDLFSAATACTVVGIRWALSILGDAGTEGVNHNYKWAIVTVMDGDSANTMNSSNGGTLYAPEQNVIAWGIGVSRADAAGTSDVFSNRWIGDAKSKRKLRIGDKLVFIIDGIATETVQVFGAVQFFCKS